MKQSTPVSQPWALGLSIGAGVVRIADNLLRVFNLSAVGAMGVFGGARLPSWQAFLLPLAIMVGTDVTLWLIHGFHPDYALWHISRPFVYGSFMGYVLLGRCLANTNSPMRIGIATLLGSAQFFLITNFSAWIENPDLYSRDLGGLVHCYAMGLAFDQGRTVIGDLLFTGVLFGVHSLVAARQPETLANTAASV